MSRDRLAQMQAEKRRAQGYAPQQAQAGPAGATAPGAPQQQPSYGAQDASMYPSPPMQQQQVAPQQASYQTQGGGGGVAGQGSYAGAAPAVQQSASYQGAPQQQQGGYPQQSMPQQGGAAGYEMQQLGSQQQQQQPYGNGAPGPGAGSNMQEFFGEIELVSQSLQQLKNNIGQIDTLHTTVLNSATNEARQESASRELEQLTTDTSRLTNNIKTRIKNMSELNDRLTNIPAGEKNTRRMQVAAQKKKFMDLLQEYRNVEAKSREKYRNRMERQYKIVKPDATPEEIKYAMETDQGSQVFASALTQSTRYADARNAYRDVQERHEDIKRIAQTMQELQQLFNDMAMLVERQDEAITTIEATANDVETNMAAANVQIDKGVKSARKARRKRWICFWVLIIVIIAIVLAVTLSILNNQGKL